MRRELFLVLIASAFLLSAVKSATAQPTPNASPRIDNSRQPTVGPSNQKRAAQKQSPSGDEVPITNATPSPHSDQKPDASQSDAQNKWFNGWSLSDEIAAITAAAAFLQFLALIPTIVLMRKSAQRQLRAYVSADPYFIVAFDETTPTSIKFTIRNVGQTPALALRHSAEIVLCPFPLPADYRFPPISSEKSPPVALFPNVPCEGVKGSRVFSAAEIADIRSRTVKIYIIGRIDYRDVFCKRHWTTFCAGVDADNDTLIKLTSYYRPSDLKITFFRAPIGNDAT